MTIVVGVDGAGRTHRLDEIAAAARVPVVRIDGRDPADPDLDAATAAAPGEVLVVVDDAHQLPAQAQRRLAVAARRGTTMAIARRPTLDSPALAELDEAVSGQGNVEQLGALDDAALTTLVSTVLGRPAPPDLLTEVRAASAGHAAVAAAVAAAAAGEVGGKSRGTGWPVAALAARLQQRLARLAPATTELVRVLALRLDLTDDVLAAAAAIDPAALPPTMRTLRDQGLLVPGGEQLIPALAQALLADLPPAERRRLHDRVAAALVASGGDPVTAATQLSAARARTGHAAEVYRAAADRLRFTDPAAASAWYEDALDAGADPASLAAGQAEVAALLGRPVYVDRAVAAGRSPTDPHPDGPDLDRSQRDEPDPVARIAWAAGAATAHQGRAERAAAALLATPPPGPALAAPVLVAVGKPAASPAGDWAPVPVRRFAEAVLMVGDPVAAVPQLIEAAEALEATPPALVLPDTPHAVGAVVAVTAGDLATAEYLLGRAIDTGAGGPVATERHRTLLAWARLRTGRFDTALAELRRLGGATLPGRESLLVAALSAGIARRNGDITRLREAWTSAEPVLARQAVDLFTLEPLEELLVAAARLHQRQRVAPVLDTLDRIVGRLGRPACWAVSLAWLRLQVAVATEDTPAAEAAADLLDAAPATGPDGAGLPPRQRAQLTAGRLWARALAGAVEPEAVVAAADALAAAQLPWEGSRLAGHAAIRTTDPVAARRLLERARELTGLEVATVEGRPDTSYGGLSDRELEVARLVLDGRTYREIGGQLYLSPKTVEHHVARIRTKLAVTSRAELVAALRRIFGEQSTPDSSA